MSTLDINKMNIIVKLAEEHLKQSDSYRFACILSNPEISFLEEQYTVLSGEEYPDARLYTLTLKK